VNFPRRAIPESTGPAVRYVARAGNALVSWSHGSFVVRDVLARLEAMAGVIDRIPPYVVRDYGKPTY